MDMLNLFLCKIAKNLNRRNSSCEQKNRTLKKIREQYKNSPIFCIDADLEDDSDLLDVELEKVNIENITVDNDIAIMSQMSTFHSKNADISPPKEAKSIEDRIRQWQEYYKDKKVFSSEEMVSTKCIDERGDFGRTELHRSVMHNNVGRINELIEAGADAKIVDNSGNTPYRLGLLEDCKEAITALEKFGIVE